MRWVYVHNWPSSPRRCVVLCWAHWMQEAGRAEGDQGAAGRSGRLLSWERHEQNHEHLYVWHSSLTTEHSHTENQISVDLIRQLIIHVMGARFSRFSWRYVVEEKWEQLGGESASSTLGWWERDGDRSAQSEDDSALISLSMFLSLLDWTSSFHLLGTASVCFQFSNIIIQPQQLSYHHTFIWLWSMHLSQEIHQEHCSAEVVVISLEGVL